MWCNIVQADRSCLVTYFGSKLKFPNQFATRNECEHWMRLLQVNQRVHRVSSRIILMSKCIKFKWKCETFHLIREKNANCKHISIRFVYRLEWLHHVSNHVKPNHRTLFKSIFWFELLWRLLSVLCLLLLTTEIYIYIPCHLLNIMVV